MSTTRLEVLKERFDELDELPYGPERIAGHHALLAAAETAGDPSFHVKVLVWISDDYMETGDQPRMIEFFDKAWERFLAEEDEIDPYVRFNLRTTFGPTLNALAADPDVPDREVLVRFNVMEAFYRKYGYSLRAVYRSRFFYHRRRGENDLATEQVELLVEEPGDYGARCDANGPMIAAQWYQTGGGSLERAAELWRSVLDLADQRCAEDHRAEAHAELTHLSTRLGRYAQARLNHRLGYPLVRRDTKQWRCLDLHMIYAEKARDVVAMLRIIHDHVEVLDAPMDDDVFWYQGRVLQFLHLLVARGHGLLPVTLADRGETTVARLRDRLEAGLDAYVAAAASPEARKELEEQLEPFRESILDKIDLPEEEENDPFWDSVLPPVPAPWAAPPNLEDLPKGWSAQDALLAEARVLDFLDHPHSDGAWARVAALGTPRSPADQARLAGYRANVLVRDGDYASSRTMWMRAAELWEQAGRAGQGMYSRMLASMCAFLTGDRAAAFAERDAVVARARAEHAAGRMEDGELLQILVEDFRLDSTTEIMAFGADPNQIMDNTETNAKFSAANELYLDKCVAHAPWATLLDAWGFYRQQMSRLYARYGLEHEFVRSATRKVDFWYAKSRDAYRDALMFFEQAEREARRGGNLLDADLFEDAELAAVEAIRLNAGLNAKNAGRFRLLQAQAIREQLGAETDRDDELLAAAREAAAMLAADDDEGAAAARALIGDVHVRAGRYDLALAVYEPVIRELAGDGPGGAGEASGGSTGVDGWSSRDARRALRRAVAGKFVCLRLLERCDEADALIEDLLAKLPEWNRVTVAWIWHDIGRAFQFLGDSQQAFDDYSQAIYLADTLGTWEPHFASLVHSAESLAPTTPKSAMTMLNEAVGVIGTAIEKELTLLAEREERSAQHAVARGEPVPERVPPVADPAMVARQARAKILRVELLFDPEPADEQILTELLPEAFRVAAEGADTLAQLIHTADPADPRRRPLLADLEAATGWLVAVQRGSGDAAGAAARWAALADLATAAEFEDVARRAAEKAQALAGGASATAGGGAQTADPVHELKAAVAAET
jgi:tetratricopeptide (TPR) repeat protein